jgi:hypothetical protein
MTEAQADFKPGLYRHYKGGYYVATGLVTHHATRMPMVLYTSCFRGTFNVRPLEGWAQYDGVSDKDGWNDMVDSGFGNQVRRFTFVDEVPGEKP